LMAEPNSARCGERVAVVGLGYVGLPVALAFAKRYPHTIGFDIDRRRVERLNAGVDSTGEVGRSELEDSTIRFTAEPGSLGDASFIVVAVPTPIDANRRPDLRALESASETVGRHLRPGTVVVYESTVYPGMTEEFCGPLLECVSGLKCGVDFKLGYSPERINPGDKEHTFERIIKVVAAQDQESLERVACAYGAVVKAGVHRASSIKVAEAAKVIENTQRDLNISLMNELVLIFDRLGINTSDVLEAAGTKWNFLPFRPGLVGGHCIGVDPYYLTAKAESVGYNPQVILAGRRINDGMGCFVAQKLIRLLAKTNSPLHRARVGVLGLAFKEDVPDIRNSRVPDIVNELREYGIEPQVFDPLVDAELALAETGIRLTDRSEFRGFDGLILAVGHRGFPQWVCSQLLELVKPDGVVLDVKSMLRGQQLPESITYWSF
jgi:UDP-N-acetyl-D-galactosamine dehydrogenase